ncbi:MAG: UDP-N-acetylmuramate--L-alanine ligase [Acidimicrobiales bacterium]
MTGLGTTALDLSVVHRIHVVGVGGAGMSAIAAVLRAMGQEVTGSDLKWAPLLDRLSAAGVTVDIGHTESNVAEADVVVVSSAVPDCNVEVAEARRRGIPVLRRSEALASIAAMRRCIAVAGTHGKTTTTSMLALILVEAGFRPSFMIGGDVNEIGTNAVWDTGEWLVLEADESDGTFLSLDVEVGVVTNLEADHLEHYGDFDSLVTAFDTFCAGARDGVIAGADSEWSARVGSRHHAVLVGQSADADWQISGLSLGRSGSRFELVSPGLDDVGLTLAVPGSHNARNAAVAAVAAMRVGVPPDAARRALARFAGVARRYEYRGEAGGVEFIDDYAHLPSEVAATVQTARGGGYGRVVAVFQPHRYTRTAAVWEELGGSFAGADVVVITDVYPAGEAPLPGVSGNLVAQSVERCNPGLEVVYAPNRAELGKTVGRLLRAGDLCLTMGAGDLTTLPDELLSDRAR